MSRLAQRIQSVSTRVSVTLAALLALTSVQADESSYSIPLHQAESGGLYVEGELNGALTTEFLVDTGSGFVVISQGTLRKLRRAGKVERVRKVAASLADGKRRVVEVYRLDRLELGTGCELGPVEVAVIPGADRNIIGLNALRKAAPFTIGLAPPSLTLSGCSQADFELAGNL